MPIQLHISPRLIPNIASLYNDTNRIFMEYIDNGLDSAEAYFDNKTNSYNKKIKISLKIEGDHIRNGKVVISDNCTGIINFNKVVESIGDSDKRGQFSTNGQFGYGIYSFMAACDRLEIISKQENGKAYYLPISASQFKTSKQDDVNFPDPEIVPYTDKSGTTIILSQFNKAMWKNIDLEAIKNEVEKHFELMLRRANLEIEIIEHSGKKYICKAFDYNKFDGDVYENKVDCLNTSQGKKNPQLFEFSPEHPIHLFLKITKGKIIERKPIFVIKGRRIAEIKDLRSFKSNHKGDIWNHPNLTGYIDLGGFLEPTIARTDFKNTPNSKALFEKLIELEELILEFLKDINKKSDEKHYKELEDELNKALSKLARIDSMNYRTDLISGKNISVNFDNSNDGEGESLEFMRGKEIHGNEEGGKNYPVRPKEIEVDENGDIISEIEDEISNKKGQDGLGVKENDNPFEDSDIKADERKKSGFNIQISDRDPDIDDETKEPLRSNVIGGTIIIFRKHQDFIKRVDKKRTGESTISQRLVTYLAGEITVHYKDKFVTKEAQPDYNKKMFVSVVDFIYKFEEMLIGAVGKNLADLS